jgi:gamma-glutamylaminecyclotransferase
MTAPNRHYVFVYGSLLSGLPNDHFLAVSEFLGAATVAAGKFAMLDLGRFPGLVLDPEGGPVVGELYAVDSLTLARLDRLEGHPYFYCRRPVRVHCDGQLRKATVYVLRSSLHVDQPLVEGNDWRRHWNRHCLALAGRTKTDG